METKFYAMVEMAEDKHFKLLDNICQLKEGNDINFEEILRLINSIHKDEIDLIVRLRDCERKLNNSGKDIQIMDFMRR